MLIEPLNSYGNCPCGGTYTARQVEVRMAIQDDTLALPQIPQGACGTCGSRVYKLADLANLEAIMNGRWVVPSDRLAG